MELEHAPEDKRPLNILQTIEARRPGPAQLRINDCTKEKAQLAVEHRWWQFPSSRMLYSPLALEEEIEAQRRVRVSNQPPIRFGWTFHDR